MSATEPLVRYRHVPLPTQQRRLRHLRSIAVRNIVQKGVPESKDLSQIETYFTLHKDPNAPAFYTSEKIKGTLNPTWRTFSLEHQGETLGQKSLNTSQCFFVVRVWRGLRDAARLCIEWSVHLGGLIYLRDKVQRDGVHHSPNTVLFGIFEGIYSMPTSPGPWDPGKCQLEVEQVSVRKSYSTQTLLRIKTVLRAIKQTQASVQRVKNSIEEKLYRSQPLEDQRSQKEMCILKNNLMHSDLEWRARALQAEKETLQNTKSENHGKEKSLKVQFTTLFKERGDLHEKKKSYFDVREDLIKTGAQLVMRRKQLISELVFIYPITEGTHNDFAICGVKLPNSEDFYGQDETMIACALGYTCHLVNMISHFLDVPLRYPMDHQGSKSFIRDHIIDKLTERERDFPLYSKGKEKFQFNYGVYLLNKNIAQLRYYCGLGTTDLRLTLSNLQSLLELRLGVKFEAANTPVLAGQYMAIPPNLGGPQSSSNPTYGLSGCRKDSSATSRSSSQSEPSVRSSSVERQLPEADTNNAVIVDTCQRAEEVTDSVTVDVGSSQTPIEAPRENAVGPLIKKELSEGKLDYLLDSGQVSHSTQNNVPRSNNSASGREQEVKSTRVGVDSVSVNEASHSIERQPEEGRVQTMNNFSPVIRTLDSLSREKLLSSVATYEDLEVSSSEDSASVTYNSRFKMWPRDQVELGPDQPWPEQVLEKTMPPSQIIPGGGATDSSNQLSDTTLSSTFKTKAMTSPISPQKTVQGTCDDLLESCDQPKPTIVPQNIKSGVSMVVGPFHRQRTDSDADSEDSATFVVPSSKPIRVSSSR